MKKIAALAAVVLFASCSHGRPPAAEYAPAQDYGLLSPEWKISPDAKKLLDDWSRIKYVRKSGRTDFFVRGQLKYGIHRSDFLHHWYDRPLLQDSGLEGKGEHFKLINPAGWLKTVEMAKLGKQTGFAVFTCTKNREEVFAAAQLPGGKTKILVELTKSLPLEDCISRAAQALESPDTYRLNGKVVLTSYPTIKEKDLPFYARLKSELTRRFGDKFLVMPYYSLCLEGRGELAEGYTADVLKKMRLRLERALAVLDGLCYNGRESSYNRRYNPWFFDTVFVPLVHAVFSAPEFKDKCLGCWSTPGHENSYRWNYGLDSTGTRMLRDMLGSVVKLSPDFMIGCEWDEENENTCFRPMVSHGFTHQRLMRYYHDIANGEKLTAFPGDDTSIPNLVLSYRKELMAGEPLEAEVVNIPDGTGDGTDITVKLAWKTPGGKVVKEFAPLKLAGGKMGAAWFVEDVSKLVGNPALVPELTVWSGSGKHVFADGFWPVGLRPTRCIEYKWVKQPLRDLPSGVSGGIAASPADGDGVGEISGFVNSPSPVRSSAGIDETDIVYMYDGESVRDRDTRRFRVAFQGYGLNGKKPLLKGRISVKGAPGAKLSIVKTRGNIAIEGHDFVLGGAVANNWSQYLMVELPRAEVEHSSITADIEGFCRGEVSLEKLERDEVVALNGPKGFNLVFTCYRSQSAIPPPANVKDAEFSFRLKPGLPNSILRLEAIDENYKVWRSKPIVFGRRSGKKVAFNVFERDKFEVARAVADSSRFLAVDYRFDPSRGSVVACKGGRNLWGILGGNVPLVTGFGQGESSYGNSAALTISEKVKGWEKAAPEYVKESDGEWALKFSGATYVSLPQQIWPVQSAFALEMEVSPDETARKQMLVFTGPTSSSLYIENGRVHAQFFLRNRFMLHNSGRAATVKIAGPEIAAGRWQTVRLVCDQHTAHIEVDGAAGDKVSVSGDLFYPFYTAIGGGGNCFFAGKIKRLGVDTLR